MSVRMAKMLVAAAILNGLVSVASLSAATIGYWRFENSPGFLNDSSGNGNTLTIVGDSVTQAALPSGIRGAAFPNPVPSNGLPNNFAADFGGTSDYLQNTALSSAPSSDFTVETFAHWENSPNNNESFSDVLVSTRNASNVIGFFLQIRTDGFNGTNPNGELFLSFNDGTNNIFVNSGFSPLPDTDYYLAAAANMSGGEISFYVKDLTNNTALQIFNVPHSGNGSLNAASVLQIGSSSISPDGFDFDGLMDEIRISNAYLSVDQLLITTHPAPEPASWLLLTTGSIAIVARQRFRRNRA